MKIRYLPDSIRYQRMTTEELRQAFLLDGLFIQGKVSLSYFDADRVIVGSAVPLGKPLKLEAPKELPTAFFAERREIGILNIGKRGRVSVDGTTHDLDNKEALYVGKGSRQIAFHSEKKSDPARFYFLSYPAHRNEPIKKAGKADSNMKHLGSPQEANQRTIYQMIRPGKIESCQLVMGFTELESGSVWNTMPPHTHDRRMEVYLYFDMEPSTRVFHLMGFPEETRHLVVADGQVVVSPSWSIHSGVGTGSYTFCWGMGGENQEFDDMDAVSMEDIR